MYKIKLNLDLKGTEERIELELQQLKISSLDSENGTMESRNLLDHINDLEEN